MGHICSGAIEITPAHEEDRSEVGWMRVAIGRVCETLVDFSENLERFAGRG